MTTFSRHLPFCQRCTRPRGIGKRSDCPGRSHLSSRGSVNNSIEHVTFPVSSHPALDITIMILPPVKPRKNEVHQSTKHCWDLLHIVRNQRQQNSGRRLTVWTSTTSLASLEVTRARRPIRRRIVSHSSTCGVRCRPKLVVIVVGAFGYAIAEGSARRAERGRRSWSPGVAEEVLDVFAREIEVGVDTKHFVVR